MHDVPRFEQVFMGLADAFGIKLLPTCVQDSLRFEEGVVAALKLFEKKTVAGIKDGLQALSDALTHTLPAAVKACDGTEAEIAAVVKALEAFGSPKSFIYHVGRDLIVNGVDIFKNIMGGIVAWRGKQYFAFGENIGKALKDVLLGSDRSAPALQLVLKKLTRKDYEHIFVGIAEGFGLEMAGECVEDSETFAQDIQKVIGEFEEKTEVGGGSLG